MESHDEVYSPGAGACIAFFVLLFFAIAGMIIGGSTKQADLGVMGGGIAGFIVVFILLGLFGKMIVKG